MSIVPFVLFSVFLLMSGTPEAEAKCGKKDCGPGEGCFLCVVGGIENPPFCSKCGKVPPECTSTC
ncbi:hypothetical protein J6590_023943 [Homalodisca vitripennis]|nr:hypothetical protein J6590_023943 [Homalodisca vitripennis]